MRWSPEGIAAACRRAAARRGPAARAQSPGSFAIRVGTLEVGTGRRQGAEEAADGSRQQKKGGGSAPSRRPAPSRVHGRAVADSRFVLAAEAAGGSRREKARLQAQVPGRQGQAQVGRSLERAVACVRRGLQPLGCQFVY